MKSLKYVFLAAVILFYSACDEKVAKQQATPPSIVKVEKVKAQDTNIYYQYAAKLEANKDVFIMPKVSGEIKEILFKDGDFVSKDAVLYKIDDEQYKASLDLALADVSIAQANYENTSTDYKRTKELYEKKAVSKKEFDAKEAAFKSAKANLTKAKAAKKIAELNYNYTEVKAPFDGYLQASLVDLGSYAMANNTKLIQIVDQNTLQADFFISDKNMEQIEKNNNDLKNARAIFTLNDKTYEGKVEFLANYKELASVKAYAVFNNENQELNAGSYVNLKIVDIKQNDSFVINKNNLLQDINGYYVYIKKEGKAEQVYIKLIFEDEKIAVVDANNSNLKIDDELILNNYKKIYPGAKVATEAEFKAMMQQAAKQGNKDK